MKKIGEIIDLPVYCEKSGIIAGIVSDILFHTPSLTPTGYIVSCGSVLRVSRYVDIKDVVKADESGVWIKDKSVLKPSKRCGRSGSIKSFRDDMEGAAFFDNGNKIGRVSDMLYNSEIGEITHFEISRGFAEDILHGRKNILANNEMIFGNNNVELRQNKKGV